MTSYAIKSCLPRVYNNSPGDESGTMTFTRLTEVFQIKQQ